MTTPFWAQRRIEFVCRAVGVNISDFYGPGRIPDVVKARRIAAYVCRMPGPEMQRLSLPGIAVACGRSDGAHAGILARLRNLEANVEQRREAEEMYRQVQAWEQLPGAVLPPPRWNVGNNVGNVA